MHEMQLKIDELTMKDSERNGQFLKLTEVMKVVLSRYLFLCCNQLIRSAFYRFCE